MNRTAPGVGDLASIRAFGGVGRPSGSPSAKTIAMATGSGVVSDGGDGYEKQEKVIGAVQVMLKTERIFYERKCKEYVQNPSVRVKDSLADSESRISQLEDQLSECTRRLQVSRSSTATSPLSSSSQSGERESPAAGGMEVRPPSSVAADSSGQPSSNANADRTQPVSTQPVNGVAAIASDSAAKPSMPRAQSDAQGHSSPSSAAGPAMLSRSERSSTISGSIVPAISPSQSFHSTRSRSTTGAATSTAEATSKVQQNYALQNIVIDDSDVDDEVASDNNTGPFSSLHNLVVNPARMAVFIRYLLDDTSQDSYPDALLFYLLTGIYSRQGGNARDMRRTAQAIVGLFFAEHAPLHVEIPSTIAEKIKAILSQKAGSDDEMKTVFNEARFALANGIIGEQLGRFRETRKIGMGTMFGDDEKLSKIKTKDENIEALKTLLSPLLEQLAGMDPTFCKVDQVNQNVSARNAALSMALLTFLEDAGVPVEGSSKVTRQSTTRKKKPIASIFSRSAKKPQYFSGHQFVQCHFNSPVFCDLCEKLLWGLGYQGLNCTACGFNVHQRSCSQSLKEPCKGEPLQRTQSRVPWKHHAIQREEPSKPDNSAVGVEDPVTAEPLTYVETLPPQPEQAKVCAGAAVSTATQIPDQGSSLELMPGDLTSTLRTRPRNTPVSKSNGAGDDVNGRRASATSIVRAQSLTYPKRPTFINKRIDRETLTVEIPPVRSPSLSDITTVTSDGPSSRDGTPDHSQEPFLSAPDPEMDYDEAQEPWVEMVSKTDPEYLEQLSKTDKNRQGFIHELIHTEATHLKKLKQLLNCFFIPIRNSELLPKGQEVRLFPELDKLIEHHRYVLSLMREKMDPDRHGYVTAISDVFHQSMGPDYGEEFIRSCGVWVSHNQENLDYIKKVQTNSSRFAAFLKTCESKEVLNRLPLTALTSNVMQRITKYPLLLEGIKKYTLREVDAAEYQSLESALTICKDTLSAVNNEVQKYENVKFLQDVQSKLDARDLEKANDFQMQSYSQLDLSLKTVVHRSDLLWRVPKRTAGVPVHAVLLTDLIVLLEYNENRTQYYLRMHEDFGSVIRVNELIARSVAVEKSSFYLLDPKLNPPKMYSLQAKNSADCVRWLEAATKVIHDMQAAKHQPSSVVRNNTIRPMQDRPLPIRPSVSIRPPQVVGKIAPTRQEAEAISDEERQERREGDFEDDLLLVDESISEKLRNMYLTSPTSSSRSTMPRRTSLGPMLNSCVQQAELVSNIARDLLQPTQTTPGSSPIPPPVLPANYQLVDISQQLCLQLSSMQSLVMIREQNIAEIQDELDKLRAKSDQLTLSSGVQDEPDGNAIDADIESIGSSDDVDATGSNFNRARTTALYELNPASESSRDEAAACAADVESDQDEDFEHC